MATTNRELVCAFKVLCGAVVMALGPAVVHAQSAKDVNVVNVPSVNANVTNQPTVHVAPGAAVAITGTPTVQVGNTTASPVIIRDADRLTEVPVMLSNTINMAPGVDAVTSPLFLNGPTFTLIGAVPTGQRLTAKFLYVDFTVPTGQQVLLSVISKLGNASLGHVVAFSSPPQTIFGQDIYRTSQPILVFVEANETVEVYLRRIPATGDAHAIVSMTGHLVDVP